MLIEVNRQVDAPDLPTPGLIRVAQAMLELLDLDPETELSLLLTDDAQMQALNREHRGLDRPTDVLSFSMREGGGLQTSPLLGDIVLSVHTLQRQARENGHEVSTEAAFLLLHGILHLLGYDHEEDADAEIMDARTRAIWKQLQPDLSRLWQKGERTPPGCRSLVDDSNPSVAQTVVGTASSRWRALVERASPFALLVALLPGFYIFMAHGLRAMHFPFPLDYGEGPILEQVLRLSHLENIYHFDPILGPFSIANYPPVYPGLLAPIAALVGPAYWYGRTLSFLAILISGSCLGLLAHHLTGKRLLGVCAPLLFWAMPYVAVWAPLFRVDNLALAFALTALTIAVLRPRRRKGNLLLIAALLTASIFTRQSYGLVVPVTLFAWLWLEASPRTAWCLFALTAILSVGCFALLQGATGGDFSFNVITANVNPFDLTRLHAELEGALKTLGFCLLLTLLATIIGLKRGRSQGLLPGLLLLTSLATAALVGKVGSNVNYFLELSAALALGSMLLLGWIWDRPLARVCVIALLLLQVWWMTPVRTFHLQRLDQKIRHQQGLERLLETVRNAEGAVLADEAMGLLPLAGRPILFQPFVMSQLARGGVWQEAPFLKAIRQQDFALIIIHQPPGSTVVGQRWTPGALREIAQHYASSSRLGFHLLYVPREEGPNQRQTPASRASEYR